MITFGDVLRLGRHDRSAGRHESHDGRPRLRLKARGQDDGYIDGEWWPRSTDLCAELPNLLAALAVRLGPARRVVYDRVSWSRVPRRVVLGGRAVELDAHRFELGNTLYIFGSAGGMIVLRVVTTADDYAAACATLMDRDA
ncbi:DUF5994 family protein [Nocardia concava]|uniref:DUF5994 family protein n=1 Tax=Nocardia concava TaxID=257281 RepID=UPI0012FAF89F|nr:DUF5994 family protein [Nocardia concava]